MKSEDTFLTKLKDASFVKRKADATKLLNLFVATGKRDIGIFILSQSNFSGGNALRLPFISRLLQLDVLYY